MVARVSTAASLYLLVFFVFDLASPEALSFNSVVKPVRGGIRVQNGGASAIQTAKSCVSHTEEESEGSGTVTSIANLSKNIIGGGMFALPAGMAAAGGTGSFSLFSDIEFTFHMLLSLSDFYYQRSGPVERLTWWCCSLTSIIDEPITDHRDLNT